ncbi:MAG TPA: hypothetical protein VFS47_17880, partial [Steroidobacteraceae bacterium]|nr:hypothetical protein [Steroidobacteraceae bacterium]
MNSRRASSFLIGLTLCSTIAFAAQAPAPDAQQLQSMQARFAPVDIKVDVKSIPENDRAVLAKLIEASRYIDALFMRQRSASTEAQLLTLLD